MKERVGVSEWVEFQWPYLMSFLGGAERVEQLARETGAFSRPRKVKSAEELLRLILIWAVGEQSLMDTALLSAEEGGPDVSDVALVKRFHKCGEWLGALLSHVLAEGRREFPAELRLRLIDATTLSRPGSKGIDHRLHLGMDLRTHRIDSVELTSGRAGETLERHRIEPGEVIVADAGYGHRTGLARVVRSDGYFITRFAWSNFPLEDAAGAPFDLFHALASLPEAEPGEFPVFFKAADGSRFAARLVAIRKSEPAASESRQKSLRERTKKGKIDLRTLEAAGYMFLLTNLPCTISSAAVLELYRFRWQVEMKFKTLKSVLHLDEIPARTPEGLRVYVLAKLLIALLIDSLVYKAESFSPWGYPLAPSQQLAVDSAHP